MMLHLTRVSFPPQSGIIFQGPEYLMVYLRVHARNTHGHNSLIYGFSHSAQLTGTLQEPDFLLARILGIGEPNKRVHHCSHTLLPDRLHPSVPDLFKGPGCALLDALPSEAQRILVTTE